MANPVVLIHGWSSDGGSFARWGEILHDAGVPTSNIHVGNYASLTNELTIKDLAEGFDRALRIQAGLKADEDFDAIVHSTGMLLLRAWLTTYPTRKSRLKHLIGLAPATNGSPLAHKGRGWLGAIFKGNKEPGPDFMEAGDRILDGLELASRFTWDLAHTDLFGETTYYGAGATTPYVFLFCGSKGYGGLTSIVHDEGSDGTVRIAGAGMDSRKIVLDLTEHPEGKRDKVVNRRGPDAPVYIVSGRHHSTILSDPPEQLQKSVLDALKVDSSQDLEKWTSAAKASFKHDEKEVDQWQQFVTRCVDERGDPITDYNVQLQYEKREGFFQGLKQFDTKVHTYRADPSLRCFHVNLTDLAKIDLTTLRMRLIASSGSELVTYHGVGSEKVGPGLTAVTERGKWDATIDLSKYVSGDGFTFFYPFTTTFIEIRLNREPLPLDATLANYICWFGDPPSRWRDR